MAAEGSSEELLSAQTRIWHYAFGCIKSMSLMVAVQLGIPDAVHGHGGPISPSVLATAVGIPAGKVPALRRLMRTLSHAGVFNRDAKAAGQCEEDSDETYSPTIFSKQLLKDNPTGASLFLLLTLYQKHVTLWYNMAAWFHEEQPKTVSPLQFAHGESLVDSLGHVPELNDLIYRAMACDSRWAMGLVCREHSEVFRGLGSLVDVGGGDGTTAKAIKDMFPKMKCTVLEKANVVAASPAMEGVDFVAGDMFELVPHADAVLLKWVLAIHNNQDCVRILRRCREAVMPAKDRGGKVIVIDGVIGRIGGGGDVHEVADVQHLFDLHMLAVTEGCERDEGEWRQLFTEAGFSFFKITPALGSRSIIEAYV